MNKVKGCTDSNLLDQDQADPEFTVEERVSPTKPRLIHITLIV